ncbi:Flp pilus assembly protein CpaB [Tautonia sp. JC769]|uniref:Flp pilus assembly protein CpaB n=1 Tax=Tautonia sp. JC769 TaxID=3232135 RepID=UPI003457EA97
MNSKAPMLLGLAALCGLGAMWGVRSVLSREPSGEIPKTLVLVASREIRVEETLTPEMIESKEIPTEMVPSGALTDVKQALDRWATIRMLPGDVILDGKLAVKGTPTGMIARITPGKRAFAVRVDEQTGVSGFILPDYRVDVLQPNAETPGRARVVLENIRVLASGTVFESPEDRSIEARTVTLEVAPEEVQILASAMENGPITLSLRGLNDVEITQVPTPEPAPETEPEPEPEPIPVPVPEPTPPAPRPPIIADEAPPAEIEAPRRLTIFAGRRAPHTRLVGPKPEPTPDIIPQAGETVEVRAPFRLDGQFPAMDAAAIPSPPG